jgi:uncharacterized protein YkwD
MPSLRFWSLCGVLASSVPALNAAPATQPGRPATNRATNRPAPDAVLTRYQLALDQMAQGRFMEARVLLETAIARQGDVPEWNLLLAFLLEREGRATQAREVLERVAPQSAVAAQYAAQLEGKPGVPARDGKVVTSERVNSEDDVESTMTHTRLAASDVRLSRLEQMMLQLVNAERARAGLAALTYSEELAEVGRAHSAEMRDRKYFSHDSPTQGMKAPMDRYKAVFERTPRLVAENIFRAWGNQHRLGDDDIRKAHDALMNSPGHRANILLRNATRLGIGIVVNANGDLWLTQIFDRP